MGPAEEDLAELYGCLVTSDHWATMAFLITFDEHGGTWDHVSPTAGISPDGIVGPTGFTFTRLGPRVPTILASPFVAPGSIFRAPPGSAQDLDHTSIVATVLSWAGIDPRTAGMGLRVAGAPTFAHALGDRVTQPDRSPIDVTGLFAGQPPKGRPGMPAGTEHVTLQQIKAAAAAASSMADYLAALAALPGPADQGAPADSDCG